MRKIFLIISLFLLSYFSLAQSSEEFRAVKLTNVDSDVLFNDQNIANAMDFLASVNINVVLPVVWNGGYTLYPSNTMDSLFSKKIHPTFVNRDMLQRVIIEAHRNGIEVYPWFEYGFATWYSGNNPPSGGFIVQKFPNWAVRNQDGSITKKNGFDWISPINPEVQNFMNKLVEENIYQYDIDGIEFSDRIPALPVEGGYDSTTVAIYKNENNGNTPPANYSDTNWMRWRANKMNQWYKNVRSLVKSYNPNLFVSSSPSIYPWAYQEYLQDVKTWIDSGICDQFIPQLYRYNLSDYLYELNSAVALSGINKNKLFAGILMNIGLPPNQYVISPDFLLASLQANRQRGVKGEAFFYYEGFRKNNNQLADTLRSTYYSLPATVPGRNGNIWRPKGNILNEDSSAVTQTGNWSFYPQQGFNGGILRTNFSSYTALDYHFDISHTAHYDVYAYFVPNTTNTLNARFVIYSSTDSNVVVVNQSDLNKKGWHKMGTAYLTSGNQRVMKIDNTLLEAGKYLVADAVMLMINRKLSPEVVITSVEEKREEEISIPKKFELFQNYPNPFNPSTKIKFSIPRSTEYYSVQHITLKVFDILGREVATLVNAEFSPGEYEVEFYINNKLSTMNYELNSNIYFYRLTAGNFSTTKKFIVLK